jgi:hypothetical protein
MDEAIEVEARFSPDGEIQPLAFRWQGHRYPVASVGRRWTEGTERRFLIMTADERVYELAFLPDVPGWRLRRTPSAFGDRGIAV